MMADNETGTPFFSTAKHEMQVDENQIHSNVIGSAILVAAILGCFAAVIVLGRDFFKGNFPSSVLVGALTWVDFLGAISSSAFVFHGYVQGEEWLAGHPQCVLQAFFTTTFGMSSGAVVTFMAIERALCLSAPYFYRKHVTNGSARIICLVISASCTLLSALPFVGIGRYKFNEGTKSFCHFDWFSPKITDQVFVFICGFLGVGMILVMLVSNVIVYVVVVRMKRKLVRVYPCEDADQPRQRREGVRQEERMATFVALVSCAFLITWLPITIRLFCNVLGVFQSDKMDGIALRLVVANFILDPFSYVILRQSFKRNVLRSVRRILASVRRASLRRHNRQITFIDSDVKRRVCILTFRKNSNISNM